MSLTKYPNGVSSFGTPLVGAGGDTVTTGNVFFVNSTHENATDGNDAKSPGEPAATIDGCIAKCTANNGDIIFVMPNHDENPLTSITMDVAGVWVRGLGYGNARPTITFGATAAAVDMTAASTRISGIIFDLGIVATTVTNCFTITAAACIVEECEIKEHASSQFTNFLTATDVEDVSIRNNRFMTLLTAGSTSGLVIDGCDYLRIYGNLISGHFGEHALDNTTATDVDECLRAFIVGNVIENKSDSGFATEMDANATGVFAHNMLGTGADFEAGFTPGNLSLWENYMWDADDTSGAIIPTTLSTS
jgi:hypothetical protein